MQVGKLLEEVVLRLTKSLLSSYVASESIVSLSKKPLSKALVVLYNLLGHIFTFFNILFYIEA